MSGFKEMVSLFNGTQSENQEPLQYGFLCKKVATTKNLCENQKDCPQLPQPQTFTLGILTYKSCIEWARMMEWIVLNEVGM